MVLSVITCGNLQSLLHNISLRHLMEICVRDPYPFLHLPAGKKRHGGFRLPTDGRRPAPRRLVSRG